MDFPEPLFEATLNERKACLACGQKLAETVLRSTTREIVPLCADCSVDWNIHGYQILRRIRPAVLLRRLALFKIRRPFQRPSMLSIRDDLKRLQDWSQKMKKWR